MRYDRDRNVVRNILKTADIANTFNGGMSKPVVHYSKMDNHYLLNVRAPGVELDKLNVEIIDKHVVVSHPLTFGYEDSEMDIPHVVATFPITIEVDYNNISASEENGKLVVKLPFSEIAGGFRRRVEINR